MGEVFLGFGRWVRRFGCAFFGLRVWEGYDFYFFGGGGRGWWWGSRGLNRWK